MKTTRRNFLAALITLPAALKAAAVARPKLVRRAGWEKLVLSPKTNGGLMEEIGPYWLQESSLAHCRSQLYLDYRNALMKNPEYAKLVNRV